MKQLGEELIKIGKYACFVVLRCRPLFDLYPDWNWWTRDGAKAADLLIPYKNDMVVMDKMHQENHHMRRGAP
jgi:hypothetical protein